MKAALREAKERAEKLRQQLVGNWELQEGGSEEEAEFAEMMHQADELCALLAKAVGQ